MQNFAVALRLAPVARPKMVSPPKGRRVSAQAQPGRSYHPPPFPHSMEDQEGLSDLEFEMEELLLTNLSKPQNLNAATRNHLSYPHSMEDVESGLTDWEDDCGAGEEGPAPA